MGCETNVETISKMQKKFMEWQAEKDLSDAYIRLREILDALDVPEGLTTWEHTENKAREAVNRGK